MDNILKGAFANNEYDDRRAMASHILVPTEEEARTILASLKSQEIKVLKMLLFSFQSAQVVTKAVLLELSNQGKWFKNLMLFVLTSPFPLKLLLGL